jgi:ATP-dependent DNA ligase
VPRQRSRVKGTDTPPAATLWDMATSTPRTADWRPQLFGKSRAQEVRDPLIEPLWEGDRVLIHVEAEAVRIVDASGEPVVDMPEIEEAVAVAATARPLVVDGYLTPQAARPDAGAMLGEVDIPDSKDMMAQMILGRGGEVRRKLAEQSGPVVEAGDPLVLVCIDLLAIESETLLDVPLLERKRLLESALDTGHLVRIGAFVRPPVDAWLGSWRAQGFRAIAYKESNGRYRPGEVAAGWAIAQIPKR